MRNIEQLHKDSRVKQVMPVPMMGAHGGRCVLRSTKRNFQWLRMNSPDAEDALGRACVSLKTLPLPHEAVTLTEAEVKELKEIFFKADSEVVVEQGRVTAFMYKP